VQYGDGGTTHASAGCGQAFQLSAQDSSTWTFSQWTTTTDGYFEGIASNPTNFHIGGSGGTIALIVWNFDTVGGYTAYSSSISQVSAWFTLPTSVSYVSTWAPVPDFDGLPIGVALGGVNGNSNPPALWEAGVMIVVPPPGTTVHVCNSDGTQQCWAISAVWMCAFTFYNNVQYRLTKYHFYCDQVPNINLGHTISVSSSYNAQYGTVSFFFQDQTTGYGYGAAVTFTPELTTSEWGVLQAACIGGQIGGYATDCYGEPNFSPVQFSSVACSAYPNLAGSVLKTYHYGWNLNANPYVHQRLVPGPLGQTNPAAFSVTYLEQ